MSSSHASVQFCPRYRVTLVREEDPAWFCADQAHPISRPDAAAAIAAAVLGDAVDREHLLLLALDTKNKLIGASIISVGSLNSAIVHPREVYKTALGLNAACIIIAHNHPSGDTSPSHEDIEMTRRICEAGRLLGVECLDHIIIGAPQTTDSGLLEWESLRQKGLM